MSGGVDSSVAALLLRRQGHEVSGVFMKNWVDPDPQGTCTAAIDADDAFAACERIGIALDAVNFADRYLERVFAVFLDEYRAGRTPNPDILCNSEIKFRAFLDHALASGAGHIATGHYARVGRHDGHYCLLKGRDPAKDQSYFLHMLDQDQLARALFPLGELHKTEVRLLAREAGLPNHARKDSTGICFIGERRFREFLGRYLPAQPGEVRTVDGRRVGRHDGLMFHTIGQRKGLGIGGRNDGSGEPWYVVAKDLRDNALIVGQGCDHPLLYSDVLIAGRLHWIAGVPPAWPLGCQAKIRYRQEDQACVVEPDGEGRVAVTFERPQRAIAPGQSVVFYRGEECLGGGVIETASARATDLAEAIVAQGGRR